MKKGIITEPQGGRSEKKKKGKSYIIKAVALILLVVFISTFIAGCGSPSKKTIDSAIQGIWVFQKDLWAVGVEFENGRAEKLFTNVFGNELEYAGSYTIDTKNETIICNWSDSKPETYKYSYNSKEKEITLWTDDVMGVKG